MPAIPAETLLGLWYRAQDAELGIAVTLADPKDLRRFVNMLYSVRKEHADPTLDEVMICLPAGGREAFLVRKSVELRDAS